MKDSERKYLLLTVKSLTENHKAKVSKITTAKITNKDGYRCSPDGYTVKRFAFGEIVTGQVAEWAIADRSAVSMMTKNAGAAPENKKAAK